MRWGEWLRTAAVAAAGGAVTGGLAAAIDPTHFNFRDWIDEEHIALMAIDGAVIAVGGLFLRSPLGVKVTALLHEIKQHLQDHLKPGGPPGSC